MFKSKRSRGSRPSSSEKSGSRKIRPVLRRSVDLLIVLGVAAAVVYLLPLVIKISRGYSRTQETPDRVVYLQVVDGQSDAGLARKVKAGLKDIAKGEMQIEIVDSDRFELRNVLRSFIIAREEDPTTARMLAERLGLNPDEVSYKPLLNNNQHATATLVLGNDAAKLLPQDSVTMEN